MLFSNRQNVLSISPVFNHINSNLYAYAANNSVKYTDPDGKNILAINDTFNISINPLGDKKLE